MRATHALSATQPSTVEAVAAGGVGWPGRREKLAEVRRRERVRAVQLAAADRVAQAEELAGTVGLVPCCITSREGPRNRGARKREELRRRKLEARLPGWKLERAGSVVRLKSEGLYRPAHSALRGAIRGWSAGSRRRMLLTLAASELDQLVRLLFVTLTYPQVGPASGREAKRHLGNLRKRWERKFGPARSAWKMEFQRRGVVHFHLAIQAPAGWQLYELRAWIARAWSEVVRSGDPNHLLAGTQCDWAARDGRRIAAYFTSYGKRASKEYQNQAPAEFPELGRWWGLWNVAVKWEREALNVEEANDCRRALVRYRQAQVREQQRCYRVRARLGSLWVIGQAAGTLARALDRLIQVRRC